jgi:predicted amidohydrolase YtcJ
MKLQNFLLAFIIVFYSACQNKDSADLILIGGKVITVDSVFSIAEAVALKGNKILDVGQTQDIINLKKADTKIIRLNGKTVIPGLIEGHAHFIGLGESKMKLDLMKSKNWNDILKTVAEAVQNANPGDWIIGRGWHQEKWDTMPNEIAEGYPVHDALSAISPENPVMLTHASGHAILVNQKAMDLADITGKTPDPQGGRIVRKADGAPSGILLENAEDLIDKAFEASQKNRTKKQIEDEQLKAISLATQECLQNGITSFHDAGEPFWIIDIFKNLAAEGKLGLRLWVMIGEKNSDLRGNLKDYPMIGYGNDFLTVRSIKRYMDGALGARGAWLLEPYSDMPETSGLNTIDLDEFRETAEIAIANGLQLCTHAIGDKANRETLNIYEEVFKEHPEKTDLRWRIEHAQHLSSEDIPRFAELGVIASMQGIHCTSDGPWVPKRLSDKRAEEGAYVWRKLLESGAVISNGTDAPVEDVDPFANFYALVTRRMNNGEQFYPDQVMTREEALKSYTISAAYSGFEENIKGSIEPGKLADLTILSDDILTIPEEQIPEIKVVYTIVDGKISYSNSDYSE